MHQLRRLVASVRRLISPAQLVHYHANEDLPSNHTSFLDLPTELLLNITTLLDKEHQRVLSHSCKQLQELLHAHLDLSLHDATTKLRFLKCLEPDYPDHLVCRSCCLMFKWRGRAPCAYACPSEVIHPRSDIMKAYPSQLRGGYDFSVTREVVDLLFRAHERGQRYGLLLPYLNMSGVDRHGNLGMNKARFVDGKLMIASRWETHADSIQRLSQKAQAFAPKLCLHAYTNVWREKVWQKVEDAILKMTESEASKVFKCPYCETDYTLRLQYNTTGGKTIVMDVWKNYGRRDDGVLAHEQIFHFNPSSRIDAEAILRRDLRADVGSLPALAPARIAGMKRGHSYQLKDRS